MACCRETAVAAKWGEAETASEIWAVIGAAVAATRDFLTAESAALYWGKAGVAW